MCLEFRRNSFDAAIPYMFSKSLLQTCEKYEQLSSVKQNISQDGQLIFYFTQWCLIVCGIWSHTKQSFWHYMFLIYEHAIAMHMQPCP